MWSERQFEAVVKGKLDATNSASAWASYIKTREDIVDHILPYIAAREPNLTDHGVDHIANVIDNVGQILGMSKSSTDLHGDLNASELLLLLMGCALHDVGNILGRKGHNLAGAEVWREAGPSHTLWSQVDRRTIMAICRAHTGKSADGSDDTLQPLSLQTHYFQSESVRAMELAAIVRLADELAEGPQRTSAFLLSKGLYDDASAPFHQYGSSTNIVIDTRGKRIAVSYDIDLDAPFFKNSSDEKAALTSFLQLLYTRVLKLEHERVFARHYAPSYIVFRETSIDINFHRHDGVTMANLKPLTLNDFNARGNDVSIITNIDENYRIDHIIKGLF